MNRQKLLLIIVTILLAIRFIILPIDAARMELLDEYHSKLSRYVKGNQLVEQQSELQSHLKQLNSALEEFQSVFPKAASSFEAQLKVQQQLQSLAKDNDIVLNQVEWVSETQGAPEKAVIKVEFSGNLKKLMLFYTQCHSIGSWLSVNDIQFRVDKQRVGWGKLGDAKGSMNVEVYYVVDGDL